MPLLSYISTSRCLIFSSLSCSFVAYIAILDINVSLNVQLFLVVDEIHFSLQFNSIGMVKRFWIVGLWYEFLSWVPYVIDIWSRCIKMVPSKFDVFMYLFCFVLFCYAFFHIPLHQCKISKLQQVVLPDGTEAKMRQSRCWIWYVSGYTVEAALCSLLIKVQMFCIIMYFVRPHSE